ncbi:MAG: chlorophyll synthesis pathway protein BchC [Pseudomonadota bacterium]
MRTNAVIFNGPRDLALAPVAIDSPSPEDVVVDVHYSGISTGTERLLWDGRMPDFPGMGYPLVPGYEATGEVVEAGSAATIPVGTQVFIPGANCFGSVRGLFGGAAGRLVSHESRVIEIDPDMGAEGALLALAATAHHALVGGPLPELIVGHGVLGRLLARLTIALNGPPPTVWEVDRGRLEDAVGYSVTLPSDDARSDYSCIMDASGAPGILDQLIGRLARHGEVVLAGFYHEPLQFTFPPAFMREARLRVAAEWRPDDLTAVRNHIDAGTLSLDGLVSHVVPAPFAPEAYQVAFADPDCLKMILDWRSRP